MRALYFFTALFCCQYSYGQWFNNVSTFTTQNGLSNNTITCLQKDSAGFLWIGTHEGLNRYDGTEFINVLSNEKNNLPSNNINKICFINKRLVAVATEGGLCLLNTATLQGKKVDMPFNPNFLNTASRIDDILYKKASKELWVCSWHGLYVFNEEGKLLKKIMAPEADMNKGFFARSFLTDARNEIYFFSQQQKGFYYPDFEKNELIPVEKKIPGFKLNELLKNDYILRSATRLDHESICILSKSESTDNEEYLAYSNTVTGRNFIDKLSINSPYEKRFFNAFPLNDSIFLINSYFGEPLLYNTNSHQFKPAADRPLWFASWPDGLVSFLYKDENNIWIATSKGLLQSSMKTNFFKTNTVLTGIIKSNEGLVSYNYGIFENEKLMVACMGAGLFALDTIHNTATTVFDRNTLPVYRKKTVATKVIGAGKSLWLFSVYGPLQVNTVTKKISLVEGIGKDSAFDDLAIDPLKDRKGNIWTTLPNGIAKYNITNGTFTNYKTKYEGGVFPLLRAGAKTEDDIGNIWMARQDTLVKFDVTTQSFSVALVKKNGKVLRPVTNMASDGSDVLYMSVAGAFGIYSISTGNIKLFTKQTGIISAAINNIVSDGEGNAWIATEGGLVFYNKLKMKFSSFTKADGLVDDEVVSVNFADEKRERLFIGFAKSYCLFDPKNFLTEKTVPQNIITQIEVDGQPLDPGLKQVLPYDQNSISFTYTGINYNQGQQNNYACRLEGFDQDWKYPGTERKINYVNLSPGTYTFKVKAANHQGEWNEEPATFTFEILPPFWQRLWFRALIIGAVVVCSYYFLQRREARIQQENNIKLQMSELRMQALRAQMNPHFIFNSLNSIQNYILSNNTIDAAGYLSKFAKLMRRILDQSNHNFLPIAEVMETLKMYVEIEAFRFNNEFTYTFDVEEDDDLFEARIPPMLLQPFAENAILHGLMPKAGDKKLLISCKLVNGSAEIIIDDNGIGRTQHNPKAGHTSQGGKLTAGMLENLQQLQHIKASIEIIDKTENEMPAGTTVKLLLPLKHHHATN
ncbi:MAG: histidine kinase [Ferruginibacter sp.]